MIIFYKEWCDICCLFLNQISLYILSRAYLKFLPHSIFYIVHYNLDLLGFIPECKIEIMDYMNT